MNLKQLKNDVFSSEKYNYEDLSANELWNNLVNDLETMNISGESIK